jgi:hypothetical protein
MKNGESAILLAPVLTPHGVLTLRRSGDSVSLEPERASRLEKAFAKGPGHGLLCLGADEVGTVLPAVLSYWREFGSRYVTERVEEGARGWLSRRRGRYAVDRIEG